MRAKEEPLDEDIITLKYINDLVGGKLIFIDFFRFSPKKYKGNIDISKVTLAWKLSNKEELYKNRIREIGDFPKIIPVISIKEGFEMSKDILKDFLQEIQQFNDQVALRITEQWLEKYDATIRDYLRASDYLLYDIGEQNPEVKFMELEELSEKEYKAKIILLNSPRKASINNGKYAPHGITDLINNCAKDKASEYKFAGYGDYCGLKDDLPSNNGSNGTGSALALLYDYESNSFYSYLNPDQSKGSKGYRELVPMILADTMILDPENRCPAIRKIKLMKGPGNWCIWININATRYIYQVYIHN